MNGKELASIFEKQRKAMHKSIREIIPFLKSDTPWYFWKNGSHTIRFKDLFPVMKNLKMYFTYQGIILKLDKEKFVELIIKLRKKYKLTQREVAERIGVKYSSISFFEKNGNRLKTDSILKLIEIYGIEISYEEIDYFEEIKNEGKKI